MGHQFDCRTHKRYIIAAMVSTVLIINLFFCFDYAYVHAFGSFLEPIDLNAVIRYISLTLVEFPTSLLCLLHTFLLSNVWMRFRRLNSVMR